MPFLIQLNFSGAGKQQVLADTGIPVRMASVVTFQSNGAAAVRVGDSSVSATRGILLVSGTPGGAATVALSLARAFLPGYFVYAAGATTVDILAEAE